MVDGKVAKNDMIQPLLQIDNARASDDYNANNPSEMTEMKEFQYREAMKTFKQSNIGRRLGSAELKVIFQHVMQEENLIWAKKQ